MKKKDFIRKTWDDQAVKFGKSHWASWGDNFAIALEIDNISEYIKNGDKVLDAGCANGFSVFEQYKRHKINITGIDFSQEMIRLAQKQLVSVGHNAKIKFKVGDIRTLPFKNGEFDVTYTTRLIINLPNWEEQKEAIAECLRVTKKGGIIVFSEAFYEPLVLLNAIRLLKQLPPLKEHDFNRYLKLSDVKLFLASKKLRYNIVDFSSIYYLGSRFLRELVTDFKSFPGYSNPINEIFFDIEKKFSGGGFGIQQAIIIKKP